MKSVLKRRVFVFFAALLLLINFSCEKESILLNSDFDAEVAETSKETNKYKTNLVTADVTSALQERLNNFSKKTKINNSPSQKDDTSFWINYNNIVELVDSIGNKTYAVQLKSREPSDRVFYNLIITERIDGSRSNPFVVRYEHDESTTRVEYRYSEDKKFKGKISSYSLESFSNSIINSRGDTSDPCWDDDIDQPDENPEAIGDGNTGSSSGGSGGGGGASSGGFEPTGNSSVGSSRPTAISSPSGDSGITGSVEVGEGCFCDPSAAQQKRMVTLTGKVSDCPEEEIAAPINDFEEIPPSCKSFKFKDVTSNWQEASVINIRFNIFVLEIVGGVKVRKKHIINFSQPVKFGMPRKFYNGTEIPPGLAAEIGAKSINHAIDDVISKYYNLVVNSTSVIRSDFQTMLKHEFQERSNGGRVNFNDMGSAPTATQYKTYAIFPDQCY